MEGSLKDAREKSESTACQIDFWFVSLFVPRRHLRQKWQMRHNDSRQKFLLSCHKCVRNFLRELFWWLWRWWRSFVLIYWITYSLSVSCLSFTVFLLPAVDLLDWTGGWSSGLCLLPEGKWKCPYIFGSEWYKMHVGSGGVWIEVWVVQIVSALWVCWRALSAA